MNNNYYKVGIYIRLSKEDDDHSNESESISNQRLMLLNYLEDNNYTLVKEYVDDGYSGTSFDRPGFKCMLKDIEDNYINMIVTKDLSRLGRDYIECGYYLEKYFPLKNIRYLALLDNIDTFKDTSNNDIIPFKAIINDWYAKDISKKVRSALKAKQKNGEYVGWKAPYGYQKDPFNKNHLVINIDQALIVKCIYELCLQGLQITAITKYLTVNNILSPQGKKEWSSKTIKTILTNQTYCGHLIQNKTNKINYKTKKVITLPKDNWIIVYNTHDPIIKEDLFNIIQLLLPYNKKNTIVKNNLLLSGLLFCAECGHALGITKHRNRKQYYLGCTYYRTHSKEKLCTPHTLNYYLLEKNIINYLQKILMKYVDINKVSLYLEKENCINRKNNQKKRDYKNKLAKLTNDKNTLYQDRLNGVIDENMYIKFNNKLEQELMKYNRLLKELNNIHDNHNYDVIINEHLTHITKELLVRMVYKIKITEDNNVTILLKIKL